MRPTLSLLPCAVILALLNPACTRHKKKGQTPGSSNTVPTENYIIPGPRTKVLSDEQLKSLTRVNETGEIVLGGAPSLRLQEASPFAEGDILVLKPHALLPDGALRRVKSVVVVGSEVVMQTEAAALTDAIQDAKIHVPITLDPTQGKETLNPQEGISGQDPAMLQLVGDKQGLYFGINDYVIADLDGNKATKGDQILLNGNLGVDAGADFILQIEGFSLKEVSFSIHGSQSGTLALTGKGGASFKEKADISILNYTPIVLTIGPFPLVITPSLGVALGAEGTVNSEFRTSASEEAKIKIGVGYLDGSFVPITDASVDGRADPPSLQAAEMSTRAFASIRGNISLYGSVGAFAGMQGFARFAAKLSDEKCYKAEAGVAAEAGLFAGIFGFKLGDYEKSWDLVSKEIGIGSCVFSVATGQDPQAYSWLYTEPSEDDNQEFPRFDLGPGDAMMGARSRNRNGYALKLSPNGAVLSYRDSQSTHVESIRAVKSLKDGSMVLAGSSAGPVITRLDPNGAVIWSFLFPIPGIFEIGAVTESPSDGALLVGGQIYTSDDVNEDMFLMKLNAKGEVLWTKRLKGPQNGDMIQAIEVLADGSIAIAGSYGISSDLAGVDPGEKTQAKLAWVGILDANGQMKRSKLYSSQVIVDIAAVKGGLDGLVLLGFTERMLDSQLIRVPWVMRLQADGSVAWQQGLLESVLPQSVSANAQGILLSGIKNFTFGDRVKHDGWLAQLSNSGNVLWARTYGSPKEDGLLFAVQTENGRILAGGYQVPEIRHVKPWFLSLSANGEGSFREGNGFTTSNDSAALYTSPLSYIDAGLVSIDLAPGRDPWDRILQPGTLVMENIAGP